MSEKKSLFPNPQDEINKRRIQEEERAREARISNYKILKISDFNDNILQRLAEINVDAGVLLNVINDVIKEQKKMGKRVVTSDFIVVKIAGYLETKKNIQDEDEILKLYSIIRDILLNNEFASPEELRNFSKKEIVERGYKDE
jgi:hypothetical protein